MTSKVYTEYCRWQLYERHRYSYAVHNIQYTHTLNKYMNSLYVYEYLYMYVPLAPGAHYTSQGD